MLENRAFLIKKKVIASLIIIFILSYSLMGLVNVSEASSSRVNYTTLDENKYPGYNKLINQLKSNHSNWKFVILYTGLDWNQVIKSENSGHGSSPKNLISNKKGEWNCSICGDRYYDNEEHAWKCASEKTIAYKMDPRNIINETDIFQFEQSKFIDSVHTIDGVMTMTANTFLKERSTAEALIDACKKANINPYQVVSRLIQEQGTKGSTMSRGKEVNGQKYYNVFNVGATGNGSAQIIQNATNYAVSQGWTSLEKSIIGGIDFLKSKYIGKMQDTIYLQKFDVDDNNGLYSNQYMQNIDAPLTEANRVKNAYTKLNMLNSNFTFLIPVYENMPKTVSEQPSSAEVYPINVEIRYNGTNIRSTPSLSASIVKTANAGEVLLSVERSMEAEGWDKVVLSDGRIAYVVATHIKQIDDVLNCNEKITIKDNTILRVGPGNAHRQVTNLEKNQIVTKIASSQYLVDGVYWDRVKLSDGRQGFIPSTTSSNIDTSDVVMVTSSNGINLRQAPGTSSNKIRGIAYGVNLTRIEKATTKIDGYYWDKVITQDGVIGYVARDYIREVLQQNHMKKDDTKMQLKIEPSVSAEKIKNEYGDKVTQIKNQDGTIITSGTIGTGAKVTIEGKIYTVVKLGDVNGDGTVDIIDMALIKRHLTGKQLLKDEYKTAGKITADSEEIDIIDMALIKRQLMGTQDITL